MAKAYQELEAIALQLATADQSDYELLLKLADRQRELSAVCCGIARQFHRTVQRCFRMESGFQCARLFWRYLAVCDSKLFHLLERGPGLVGFTSGSPKHQHALAAVVIEAAFLGQGEQAFLAVPHQLVTLHVMRHLARAMPGLQPAPQPSPLAESGQARELEPVRGRRPGHAKASLGLTPGSCPAWRDQSAACKAGLFCNGASALEHMDLMAIQRQFVGGGRSHHARSNHGDLQDATPTGA